MTAHDKLLVFGWKKTDDLRYEKILKHDNYEKTYMVIEIHKKEKKFRGTWYYDNDFSSIYRQYSLSFDIELAKILIEYLEEL